MPLPAGIRWPMMMFSLRPRRSSLAPRMAASVSTRVVSWNDAAEMNDCVVRLGFVRRTGLRLGVHVDLALTALDLAELDDAVHLGDRGRILRPPRLEQLRDAREAARDVARLVRLPRDLGDRDALGHLDRRAQEDRLVLRLLLGLARPRFVDRPLVHMELGAPRIGGVRDLH